MHICTHFVLADLTELKVNTAFQLNLQYQVRREKSFTIEIY